MQTHTFINGYYSWESSVRWKKKKMHRWHRSVVFHWASLPAAIMFFIAYLMWEIQRRRFNVLDGLIKRIQMTLIWVYQRQQSADASPADEFTVNDATFPPWKLIFLVNENVQVQFQRSQFITVKIDTPSYTTNKDTSLVLSFPLREETTGSIKCSLFVKHLFYINSTRGVLLCPRSPVSSCTDGGSCTREVDGAQQPCCYTTFWDLLHGEYILQLIYFILNRWWNKLIYILSAASCVMYVCSPGSQKDLSPSYVMHQLI